MRAAFRPLRSRFVFPTVRLALAGANGWDSEGFRIVHFSVQFDHLHLIVEASDKRTLSAGIRSLAIRIARYVNELVGRKGKFWADRWFGVELRTPRQVRSALVYVLGNFRKHAGWHSRAGVDPYSSGTSFDGWRGFGQAGRDPPLAGEFVSCDKTLIVTSEASAWLLRTGWRRYGLLRIDEVPVTQ
jgi:hypothetical protein